MKISAQVNEADGSPMKSGAVQIVSPGGVFAEGRVNAGNLSAATPDPMPAVWAVSIADRPVLAVPVTADDASVDLGEIVMVADGVAWPVFHAPDGRVFGVPRAALDVAPPVGGPTPPIGPARKPVDFSSAVPLGALLDSTAEQLKDAATAGEGVTFTGATVTVRGLPTGSGSDFALQFPTAEQARNATGLSELSFAVRPNFTPPIIPVTPQAPKVPDLAGYTRELAIRKLSAAGLAATVAAEVVTDPHAVGRVVRQSPNAGEPAPTDAAIRLFIGTSTTGAP